MKNTQIKCHQTNKITNTKAQNQSKQTQNKHKINSIPEHSITKVKHNKSKTQTKHFNNKQNQPTNLTKIKNYKQIKHQQVSKLTIKSTITSIQKVKSNKPKIQTQSP